MQLVLTPELLLEAYRQGLFPMAPYANSAQIHWLCPELRGQLSISALHIPKSLKKTIMQNIKRNGPYVITHDRAFEEVLLECARAAPDRPETWINEPIRKACLALYERGFAHSIECWRQEGDEKLLVGGLYGIALGGAFFGESMFSRESNTSKICLVHLVARLWRGGYSLLDAQFVNEHLRQFGIYEVPKNIYKKQLAEAIANSQADFKLMGQTERDIVNSYLAMRFTRSN